MKRPQFLLFPIWFNMIFNRETGVCALAILATPD